MKAVQALFYFMIVNGMLYMFTTIGIFSQAAILGVPMGDYTAGGWGITNTLGFLGLTGWSGIGTFALATLTAGVGYRLAGVNPLVGIAFGAFIGIFSGMWIRVFGVMNNIAGALGDSAYIMYAFIGILTTIFAISIVWGMIQMATQRFD